ncbi:5-oxoprolinase subunit B family protein [Janibacter limosus]|jgi:urea carboxylase|uniref:5-oxoprolinase subunit B family protein n=1 Tax=Janibacter limosus TaxID=53458 RepID=UPI00083524DB|nr:carboxyltransferase domain-containing protein [Janibacter limosus]
MTERVQLPPARYEHGADEFIFVEIAEAMSMEANVKAMLITQELAARDLAGIVDICPSNASYLVRFDPDVIAPADLMALLRELEQTFSEVPDDFTLQTRVVDIPVLYNDPWTHEALMRFRDRHQDPESTDLEYGARTNGFESVQAFIDHLSGNPWIVTMLGFVPGLPFCYQLEPRERQVEVPKYVRPRTFTPERAFGIGGAFSVIYPVQGAGGYQLYGMSATPVLNVRQDHPDFDHSIVFPRPGDILRYRSVDRTEFDETRAAVEAGSFRYRQQDVEFSPAAFLGDPQGVNDHLLEVLYR